MNATSSDIGIPENDRQDIIRGMNHMLADTYTLYLQTHNFHWNVTGPMFNSLHTMFEAQYTELAVAVDDIAERIRSLGGLAPATFAEFLELSSVREVRGNLSANDMIATLVASNEAVIKTARKVFPVADKAGDESTADLLTGRLRIHEKTAWMLRSLLA